MLIKLHFVIVCSLIGLLTGCATPLHRPKDLQTIDHPKVSKQSSPLKNFNVQGKMGFSDGKQGGHANIEWGQRYLNYKIRLYGPLGSGSIQIVKEANHVILIQSNGKKSIAQKPEHLVHSYLGVTVPVSGLQYWLLGIPAPGIPPTQVQIDKQNRLWQIQQQGWTIYYEDYERKNGMEIPYKLTLKNGPIRLKFVFRNWDLQPNIDTF